MQINIREYRPSDLKAMIDIWNSVVIAGNAFPQTETLKEDSAREFFGAQSFTGVAVDEKDRVLGLYILHPNNVGRCSHIANSSYAVHKDFRGNHIGESLVRHSIVTAKQQGFKILQFNAVVCNNLAAIKLYEKLGFVKVGVIPGGFKLDTGEFLDIIIYYIKL
ncbi:MAG TPA: GNAT family N-acetyltransferase [Clostridiales bacterium]|nr:GNAT family N-acetyltransferase [Clostridiales bacterium]